MKILPCLVLFAVFVGILSAQTVSIAPYKDGKSGAFSFTLDDGYRDSVVESRQVFQETGVRATYFLMPVSMGSPKAGLLSWKDAKGLLAEGHEIGGHARVSPKLHEADAETLASVVSGGRDLFEEKLGYRAYSFAMPGGSKRTPEVGAEIFKEYGIIRDGKLAQGWGSAKKGVEWPVAKTRSQVARVLDSGGWGMAVIHGITNGYRPFSSIRHFKEHVEAVTSEKDRLWIAPMGEVGLYVDTAGRTKLTKLEKPGGMEITLGLEPSEKEGSAVPITLVIKPDGKAIKNVTATQSGKTLETGSKDGNFLIDAVPGGDPVLLSWK